MSYWACKKLAPNGELLWERDIWNDSAMMAAWIWLAAKEQGIDWDD